MKIEEYNFYYEADKEHNPKKDAVWTSAYLDPAGQGWMVSCIVPIYKGEFLEGVTGLDVTIDSFIKNILNLKLPWSAQAFLVSNDGLILAMPQKVEEIFHLNELKNHTYTNVVTEDNLKPEEFNIYKNPKLSRYFGNLLHSDTFMVQSTIDNKEYIIAQSNIEQTNWKLFVIVDKSIVYAPLSEMEKVSSNLGLIAIVGMILFYLLFFLFLHKRIIRISNFISEPIANLANITKNFTTNLALVKVQKSDVEEIDLLFKNFNEMTNELYSNKKALEELNRSLEFKVQSELAKNRQKDQTLLQQSRLAQMGELMSMIAHQWRQPLAAISSMTLRMKFKILLENFDFSTKEGQNEFLNYVKDETSNIDEMIENLTVTIDDFRDFYKPTKEIQRLSPIVPIKKALSMLKPEFIEQQIEVKVEYLFEGDIDIYENEFMQVVLNILKNASDNFKEKGIEKRVITIQVEAIERKVKIIFGDNGGGIPSDIKEKIFDPYFSTKDEKNGTGLGLYMSKMIIEQHHKGKIEVETIGDRAYFIIELPQKIVIG
jgi:signal transduction histidine kinase